MAAPVRVAQLDALALDEVLAVAVGKSLGLAARALFVSLC
tara:strand:+ start:1762 stop:1881 length:120 start_codon:yes stop_codon:yes gene_type:complete